MPLTFVNVLLTCLLLCLCYACVKRASGKIGFTKRVTVIEQVITYLLTHFTYLSFKHVFLLMQCMVRKGEPFALLYDDCVFAFVRLSVFCISSSRL